PRGSPARPSDRSEVAPVARPRSEPNALLRHTTLRVGDDVSGRVRDDGTLVISGANIVSTPTPVAELRGVVAFAPNRSRGSRACAALEDGSVRCWRPRDGAAATFSRVDDAKEVVDLDGAGDEFVLSIARGRSCAGEGWLAHKALGSNSSLFAGFFSE